MPDFSAYETKLGVKFINRDLLKEALTHRSYLNENTKWKVPHNERLEYLGDAVLELVVSEELYERFPAYPEGKLTVLRASLVNYQLLAKVAIDIGLSEQILMSRGEAKDKGKAREVILANAMEALIGAIYLDQGLNSTRSFIDRVVLINLENILKTKSYRDAKSELQEIAQERLKVTPTYKVIKEEGPAHQRVFKIGVYFGEDLVAQGEGTSKQEAETEAAKNALRQQSIG